jgi:hypothetical protein
MINNKLIMEIPNQILDQVARGEFKATLENWIYTIRDPIPTFQPEGKAFIPFCIQGELDGVMVDTSRIKYRDFESDVKWVYTFSGSLYRLGQPRATD